MKVEIENLEGHNKKLTIEVPVETVAAHLDNYYKEVQKTVTLKGFRKGKAPLPMVKNLYSDSAASRVTQGIVEKHLGEALRTHSLTPITLPQVDAEALRENMPFKFSATFEASPPVELKNYLGLKLERKNEEVTPEEIEKALGGVQDQLASFAPLLDLNPVLSVGHFAQLDYQASENGQPFAEASETGAVLEIGSGSLAPDFEKNVMGMKVGDTRSFSVTFPAVENEAERLPVSGKTLDFTATLRDLRKKTRPELTDELAQKVGPFKTVAELRTRVEQDLKNQKESSQRRDLQEKTLSWLIVENPVDVPESMLSRQMEQLAIDAGLQLSQMGLDEKAIEERLGGWGDQMLERATRQIKASMLLGAIAKKEGIQASDDDIRTEISRIAVQSNRSPQIVLEDFQKRGLVGGLVKQVTELKALDWVLEKAL